MAITGIVVEYNPFHNGHFYQINTIKEQPDHDALIVIMSGQFTQRGTPCITDKHTRAKMCLAHGVDMVLELPTPYATASAERFCEAAISTLHQSGIIDRLSFGCETNDIDLISLVAKTLLEEPSEVSDTLKSLLSSGVSYPKARQEALMSYLNTQVPSTKHKSLQALLTSPNNILGIEYVKALYKYQSSIIPMPLHRKHAGYHDESITHNIASATAIRHQLKQKHFDLVSKAMPTAAYHLLLDTYMPMVTLDDYSDLFHYKLIFSNSEDLYALWDIPKNLCLSLIKASQTHYKLSDIIDVVTSKTYTRATVTRAVLRVLLNLEHSLMKDLEKTHWIPHIRVLACKDDKKYLLSKLTKSSSVPIITNFGKHYREATGLSKRLLDLEVAATKLYALTKHQPLLSHADFTKSIFFKE